MFSRSPLCRCLDGNRHPLPRQSSGHTDHLRLFYSPPIHSADFSHRVTLACQGTQYNPVIRNALFVSYHLFFGFFLPDAGGSFLGAAGSGGSFLLSFLLRASTCLYLCTFSSNGLMLSASS